MNRIATLLLTAALVVGSSAAAPIAAVAATADSAPGMAGVLPPDASLVASTDLAATTPAASLAKFGTLRVPSFGVSQTVYNWGCGPATVPNLVLKWGCVTTRNTFLTGHASGVFHWLYNAYVHNTWRAMHDAYFTTAKGVTTRYRISWIRLVPASYIYRGITGERWAWNNTAHPSLTLQTCWGSTNKYRLVFRFVKG